MNKYIFKAALTIIISLILMLSLTTTSHSQEEGLIEEVPLQESFMIPESTVQYLDESAYFPSQPYEDVIIDPQGEGSGPNGAPCVILKDLGTYSGTVNVCPGKYYFNYGIAIQGGTSANINAHGAEIIANNPGTGTAVQISQSNVVISGLKIKDFAIGFWIFSGDNITIDENIIENAHKGVFSRRGDNLAVLKNVFLNIEASGIETEPYDPVVRNKHHYEYNHIVVKGINSFQGFTPAGIRLTPKTPTKSHKDTKINDNVITYVGCTDPNAIYCWGNGIDVQGGENIEIIRNYVSNFLGFGIRVGDYNSKVLNNEIFNVTPHNLFVSVGIGIDSYFQDVNSRNGVFQSNFVTAKPGTQKGVIGIFHSNFFHSVILGNTIDHNQIEGFEYGYLGGLSSTQLSNTLTNNNFLNNTTQVRDTINILHPIIADKNFFDDHICLPANQDTEFCTNPYVWGTSQDNQPRRYINPLPDRTP